MREKSYKLCIAEDYKVVVRDYIVVIDSTTIHGVPLDHDTYRVAIKIVICPNAHLPILVDDEIIFVKGAVNIIIVWPQHLVFRPNKMPTNLILFIICNENLL